MKVVAERSWPSVGRSLARKSLKKFFQDKQTYLEKCGCNELNANSQSCLDCLVRQVEGILSDMVAKESVTPGSKLVLPETERETEELSEAARDFIERSLKRTISSGSMFYRSSGEAMVTNPTEAYELGVTMGQDAVNEAARDNPEDQNTELEIKAKDAINENRPNVHSIIAEYFDKGVEDAVHSFLGRRVQQLTTEKISTSRKEFRAARYEKAAINC